MVDFDQGRNRHLRSLRARLNADPDPKIQVFVVTTDNNSMRVNPDARIAAVGAERLVG
jgi:hypothetical protein